MASVAEITPLSSEFDMPSGDGIQKEITKLGQVIIEKSTQGLKSATQAVISSVPKMIEDLTREIESGPVDNFALAMRKLINLVDELGIDLRDYNKQLADTVQEFTGSQEKLEKKLNELREQGIKAEINEKGNAIKILTQKEIKDYQFRQTEISKLVEKNQNEIKERIQLLNQLNETDKKGRKELEKEIQTRSENVEGLKQENEQINNRLNTTVDTGRDTGGFGKLAELKDAFMVIPDTIAEVTTTFAEAGKSVFGFIKMFKEPMKAFKSIGESLGAIGNIFKTARILIALKVLLVVAAIQWFAEKIDSIGKFFVGIWEKITGFFQGIVDWFKNSTIGKLLGFGDKDKSKEEDGSNKGAEYGTGASMGAETDYDVGNDFNAPVRNMTSATLEDGLVNQTVDPTLSDYDDNSAKIIAQRQIAGMDGAGTEEIDYTGVRGGTSLSQLGFKKRQVVGDQLQTDDTMYGGVSESLKELNAEASASPNVINIQNNSSVNSNSSSGTTVSGFVDHEPDTSFKYIRSGATGSDQF